MSITASPRPASTTPATTSARETSSQRASLRALQKRREQQQVAQAALHGAAQAAVQPRPKVRNYNLRDDEPAMHQQGQGNRQAAGPAVVAASTVD